MDNAKSYSISTIRVISMLCIVLCHFFQSSDNLLAWWFNVGVQIFLCISGFLYSNRNIESYSTFYLKRAKKILIPVYLYVAIIMIIHFIFIGRLNYKSVLTYLLQIQGIYSKYKLYEFSHLWFITLIILCYLMIYPLNHIKKIYNRLGKVTLNKYVVCLFASMLLFLLFAKGTFVYLCIFLFVYIIGFYFKMKIPFKITVIFFILSVIFCASRIKLEYFSTAGSGIIQGITIIEQAFLGMFLFMFLYEVLQKYYFNRKLNKVIKLLDDYSYEIYIVHGTWIMGPLAIFDVNKIGSSTCATVLLIVLTAALLKKITKKVNDLI